MRLVPERRWSADILSASVRSTLNLSIYSRGAGVRRFALRAQADRMSAIYQRSRF
jgi:hypothetical protein